MTNSVQCQICFIFPITQGQEFFRHYWGEEDVIKSHEKVEQEKSVITQKCKLLLLVK